MIFITWNVNGLRAAVKKGFSEFFNESRADFFAIQETKLQAGQLDLQFPGYASFYSYAERKGYSGTAVFTPHQPLNVIYDIPRPRLAEGRVTALEMENFYFVNVYTPNIQSGLARSAVREQWDAGFLEFIKSLDSSKPVVICGDMNVGREDIDVYDAENEHDSAGFSDGERRDFEKIISSGFTDAFRYLHPDRRDAYTWWSYMNFARRRNHGWRIDYFLVSDRIADKIRSVEILSDVMGSDHAPVRLNLALR